MRTPKPRSPPDPNAPPPPVDPNASRAPAELLGDWYLIDPYEGRSVYALPCASKPSHLVIEDTASGVRVAARRVQAVFIGKVSTVAGGDGTWQFGMGDKGSWTFQLLDPERRSLRWTGHDPSLIGPWVRAADVDAYEYLALPESACKRADPVPTLPADLPKTFWPIQWTGTRYEAAPGGGTQAPLELVTDGGLTVVRRSGKGEERWSVLRVDATPTRVDLTLRNGADGFAGMRIMKERPKPPAVEVSGAPDTAPRAPDVPPAAGSPLPDGAWFISLPTRPAYTAGVWSPNPASLPR